MLGKYQDRHHLSGASETAEHRYQAVRGWKKDKGRQTKFCYVVLYSGFHTRLSAVLLSPELGNRLTSHRENTAAPIPSTPDFLCPLCLITGEGGAEEDFFHLMNASSILHLQNESGQIWWQDVNACLLKREQSEEESRITNQRGKKEAVSVPLHFFWQK